MKKMLVIMQQSPFSAAKAREAQDLLMALAAVEYEVSVLYRGAAICQLLAKSNELTDLKDFTKAQKLFDLYDVAAVYCCARSYQQFQHLGLQRECEPLDLLQQQALIAAFDEVFVC